MHSKQCLLKRGEVAQLLRQVVSLSPCTQGSHCPNEYAHVLSACMSHVLRNCIEGTSTAPRNQGSLLSKCCTLCRHGCCHACLQEVSESAIVCHFLSSSQPLEPMPAMCACTMGGYWQTEEDGWQFYCQFFTLLVLSCDYTTYMRDQNKHTHIYIYICMLYIYICRVAPDI